MNRDDRKSSRIPTYSHYDSRVTKESFIHSLRSILSSYDLISILVNRELANRYRRSVLGIFWSLLTPLITTSVIYFVFRGIFEGSLPSSKGYYVYVYTGLIIQSLILSGIPGCASALVNNRYHLTRLPIPPYIFAVASSFVYAIQFMVSSLASIPILILTENTINLAILFLPIFSFFTALFICGIGMSLAGLVMRFDDGYQLISTCLMILTYLTPIFYSLDALDSTIRRIVELNPLSYIVAVARFLMLPEQDISLMLIFVFISVSILIFLFGLRNIIKKWNDWIFLL